MKSLIIALSTKTCIGAVVLATILSCFSTPAELEPGRPKVPVASVYVDGKEVLSGQIEYFGRDVDENWRQLRDVEFVATKDFASLGVGKDDNHFFLRGVNDNVYDVFVEMGFGGLSFCKTLKISRVIAPDGAPTERWKIVSDYVLDSTHRYLRRTNVVIATFKEINEARAQRELQKANNEE